MVETGQGGCGGDRGRPRSADTGQAAGEPTPRPCPLPMFTPPPTFLLAAFLLCEVNTQGNGAEGKVSPRPGLCSLGPGVGGWSWHQGCSELQPRGGPGDASSVPACVRAPGNPQIPASDLCRAQQAPPRPRPQARSSRPPGGAQGLLICAARSARCAPAAALPAPRSLGQHWPGGGGAALRGGRETKGGDREPRVRKPRAKTTTVGQRPATSFHDLWPPKPLCKVVSAPHFIDEDTEDQGGCGPPEVTRLLGRRAGLSAGDCPPGTRQGRAWKWPRWVSLGVDGVTLEPRGATFRPRAEAGQ